MLDFTSSLYLGFWHDSRSLRPWARLTTGVPAALSVPPVAQAVSASLARLQGCERATLGPSTFHLFWDLFGMLAADDIALYVDEGAYPIARWGTANAALRGVPVQRVPHRNAAALRQLVTQLPGLKPVVVADGACACCSKLLPIRAYLEVVRAYRGLLVLDDTQPLGILGHSPESTAPYGRGGGGTLQHAGVSSRDVILVCSLAKAFGAPLASLSGSRDLVERFEATSETRVHCSPPSVAALHAAARALALNEVRGDELRRLLAQRVRFFKERLAAAGLPGMAGLCPVQRLPPLPSAVARDLHARLLASGVRTVLQPLRMGDCARITFVLTARHQFEAIARAVDVLAGLARGLPWLQPGHI